MEIGTKIKALRLQCGLTQEELASRTELTKGFISQLENDLTSPSISTLVDLLSVLGCDLEKFFSADKEEQIVFSPDDFFEKEADGNKVTWLVPNSQKNNMEPILQEIAPHATLTEDMPHEGEEFGYILKGQGILHIGKRTEKIKQGDSFYFTAGRVHFIENNTDNPLILIWVASPPNF